MKRIKVPFYLLLILLLLNACKKEYSVENNSLKVHTGTWQFNDSLTLFSGNMDSAYIDSSTRTKVLYLIGTSLNGSQNFHMELYADTFKTVESNLNSDNSKMILISVGIDNPEEIITEGFNKAEYFFANPDQL